MLKQINNYRVETSNTRTIDENGYMSVSASPILRSGILEYLGHEISDDEGYCDGVHVEDDKIYRVYLPLVELKNAASTFNLIPIVNDHTWLGSEGEDAKRYQEGTTGTDAHVEGDKLYVSLKLTGDGIINALNSGKTELSASYTNILTKAVGKPYDFVASNYRGNHIALVDKGRCGPEVRVANDVFKETEHPRDSEGKFTESGTDTGEPLEGYVKSNPERSVKFTESPFDISSDRHEIINNFKKWYKNNLQGRSVINPVLGEIHFFRSGMQESTYQNIHTIENLKYIVIVPKIIESSKDVIKENLKHYKQGVKSAYRIRGYVDIDNKKRLLNIIVLEDKNGNKFYTIDARGEQADTAVTKRAEPPLQNKLYNKSNNVNDFVESEHPRDAEGKFTDTGAGESKRTTTGEPVSGYQASSPNDAITFKGSPFKIDLNDRKKTFDNFKSWYKENLQGRSVTNPLLGKVYFYRPAMLETWHQNRKILDNLKYIVTIPWIIKKSKDIVKEEVKHPKPGVKCVYRIHGFINDQNKTRKINIVILEHIDGNKYYTIDAREKVHQTETESTRSGQ